MKSKYLYLGLFAALFTFFLTTAFMENDAGGAASRNKDLIKFSHEFHLELTDCSSCHSKVEGSTSLNDRLLPSMDDCAGCHDVEDEEKCSTCHYEEVLEPLIQKKSGMIFSHKYHVSEENLECTNCHKGLDRVDYSFKAEGLTPPMNTCYQCHNLSG